MGYQTKILFVIVLLWKHDPHLIKVTITIAVTW